MFMGIKLNSTEYHEWAPHKMKMTTMADNDRFDKGAQDYLAYAETPEGRLRSDLAFGNLEDFVSGVPVDEATPVDSCEIRVAVALQGVQAGPDIVPIARPALPGDSPPQ